MSQVPSSSPSILVGARRIGAGAPCFIIAEAGVNHNGDPGLARQLVDVAAAAGADAVKFQTFNAAKLIAPVAPKAAYQRVTTGADESQLAMVRKLELPLAVFGELADLCRQRGILFLSTPFDEESADALEAAGLPAFKIPSGEITNLPFLAYLTRMGRPLILSTGMSSLGEVETALQTVRAAGNPPIALLHCVSSYPASPCEVNLRAMHTLAGAFGVPVGYSDHTLGIEVPLAAVALGACIIEKHFTLDRAMSGPDHKASADPAELKALVQGIRTVEASLGHGRKEAAPGEADTAAAARRSLVAARDIPAGTALTPELITAMRPGTGLPPSAKPYLLGRTTCVTITQGSLLSLEMLA